MGKIGNKQHLEGDIKMTYEEFIIEVEKKTDDNRPSYKTTLKYQPTPINIHPTEYQNQTSNPDPSLLWEKIRGENCSFLWDGKEYHAVQDTLDVLIYLKGEMILELGRWDPVSVSKLEQSLCRGH